MYRIVNLFRYMIYLHLLLLLFLYLEKEGGAKYGFRKGHFLLMLSDALKDVSGGEAV